MPGIASGGTAGALLRMLARSRKDQDMTQEEVDRLLATMDSQSQVVTANLLELEDLPMYKELTSSTSPPQLTGRTQAMVEPALAAVQELWRYFGLFNGLLRQARDLRGTDRKIRDTKIAELEELLTGRSIKLPAKKIPLAQRGLLTGAETDDSITPDDLLRAMSAAFDTAKSVVLEIDAAWDLLLPACTRARDESSALGKLCAELGMTPTPELLAARAQLELFKRLVAFDPLGVSAGLDQEVASALAAARAQLTNLKEQRDLIPADLDRARVLLDEIQQLAGRGRAALDLTRQKILQPEGLKEPLDASILSVEPRGLIPWLSRLEALAAGPRWQTARRGLDQWMLAADGTRATAQEILTANETPYQARNELRGLLDALKAKAAASGLAEDPQCTRLYGEARDLLYTAPCDLSGAGAAVSRYGALLR